jgi:hypothetical protein
MSLKKSSGTHIATDVLVSTLPGYEVRSYEGQNLVMPAMWTLKMVVIGILLKNIGDVKD